MFLNSQFGKPNLILLIKVQNSIISGYEIIAKILKIGGFGGSSIMVWQTNDECMVKTRTLYFNSEKMALVLSVGIFYKAKVKNAFQLF